MMRSLFVSLLAILAYTVQGQSYENIQLASCKIVYLYYDGTYRGTKTLIFADSGRIERVSVVSHPDTTNPNIPKEILNGLRAFKVTVIKTRDSVFTIDEESKQVEKRSRISLGASVGPVPGMKKVAVDKFQNRECEVYDLDGFKIWYWKGIALKKEMIFEEGAKVFETATSVDEKYVIRKADFQIQRFAE